MLADALRKASASLETFLRTAACYGCVKIVTNSEFGWVEKSIKQYLPSVESLVQSLGIEIVYAQYALTDAQRAIAEENADEQRTQKSVAMQHIFHDRPWK